MCWDVASRTNWVVDITTRITVAGGVDNMTRWDNDGLTRKNVSGMFTTEQN